MCKARFVTKTGEEWRTYNLPLDLATKIAKSYAKRRGWLVASVIRLY